MNFNSIQERLSRMYASVGTIRIEDWRKAVVRPTPHDPRPNISFGPQDPHENALKILNVIHSLANFKDHLKNKMTEQGKDKNLVERFIEKQHSLELVIDMSNADKHGYPTKSNRSKRNPRLINVRSALRIKSYSPDGWGPMLDLMTLELTDSPGGSHHAYIEINADIVDFNGKKIKRLDEIIDDAISAWESFIMAYNLSE